MFIEIQKDCVSHAKSSDHKYTVKNIFNRTQIEQTVLIRLLPNLKMCKILTQ